MTRGYPVAIRFALPPQDRSLPLRAHRQNGIRWELANYGETMMGYRVLIRLPGVPPRPHARRILVCTGYTDPAACVHVQAPVIA